MLPASAVPVIVGVLSFPWEVFVKDVGALGDVVFVVSTVINKTEDEIEVLPAASIDIACNG